MAIHVQIFIGISDLNNTPTNSVFNAQILTTGTKVTNIIVRSAAIPIISRDVIQKLYNLKVYKHYERRNSNFCLTKDGKGRRSFSNMMSL